MKRITEENDFFRKSYHDGLCAYIKRRESESGAKREARMPVEDFPSRIETYRREYREMLGLDVFCEKTPAPSLTKLGEDEDAEIFRAVVYVAPEVPMWGLLFLPHGVKKAPLIIAQHGGGGTPELCSDLNGKNNYNYMVRRLLAKGAVVFAPQLLLWNVTKDLPTQPKHDIPFNRHGIDKDLDRFGTSITALEITGISRFIDFLSAQPFVDEEKIGMIGISYGGYFTLHTMAADTRIKAGYSCACFNDRNAYSWQDWSYHGSAELFHDAEVAALCAPRALYVSVGKSDPVFDYTSAVPEAARVGKYFAAFGCEKNFVFDLWEGGHTLPDAEDGISFMFAALADKNC